MCYSWVEKICFRVHQAGLLSNIHKGAKYSGLDPINESNTHTFRERRES